MHSPVFLGYYTHAIVHPDFVGIHHQRSLPLPHSLIKDHAVVLHHHQVIHPTVAGINVYSAEITPSTT